ncbi:MAG: MMPL family transporter, partial [Gammaproteobacteria bacterium]|nr:MMPL family transporter [Gammaproteobacteria bacterium]
MPPNQHSSFDRYWVAYGNWLVRWRWLAVAASLMIAGVAGFGSQNLWFDNNYRAFFSDENPQLQAFEELQNTYTKHDNILIVLAPASGDVFSPAVLTAVKDLTDAAWRFSYAIRVDSVTNFQHTRAQEDDLLVADLVENPKNMDIASLAYARSVATSEPALLRRLINADASVTALNVTFQLPDPVTNEVTEIVADVRRAVAEFEAANPDIAVKLTGTVMMNNAFFEASFNDIKTLVPFMYLTIIITMLILLRCLSSTLGTVLVIGASVVTAMGLAGWLGMKLTSPSASAPTVIMTLAVADCVHLLVTMFAQMRRGLDKRAAIVESIRINMQPVFLTSITTAIGFLTLNFSDAPPFRDLGNITAMGVMAAFFFAIFMLPAFVAIMPCRKPAANGGSSSALIDRFGNFVVVRRKGLLIGSVLVSLIVLSFVPRNELNDEFVQYFKPGIEFRQHTDFTTDNLTGLYQVQYSLKADGANGVSDPEFLNKLEAFSTWYRSQPRVMHVSTMTDTFKRLNQNLHGDDRDWYKLPDSRELAAQYLLLYEMSLPFGLDLNNQLNIDKSSTQFVA